MSQAHATELQAPTLNTATGGINQVELQWSTVNGATGYKVYYGTSSGQYGSPISVGDVTQYTVTGLNASTTYYFAVTAVNAGTESQKSNEKSATTSSNSIPSAPVLNPAAGGANQVSLQWSSVNGATSYKVYYGTASGQYGTPVNVGNVTQYAVTGLAASTTYYLAVTAVNSYGESSKSNERSAATSAGQPPADEDVVWTDLVGVSANGNNLTKTAATGWGNGGAASSQTRTGDFALKFTATSAQTESMIGLSTTNADADYTSINYGIDPYQGAFYVFESGVVIGCVGSFESGDILSIERIGDTIYYKNNGETLYTSLTTISNNTPLMADVALNETGSGVSNARFTGPTVPVPEAPVLNTATGGVTLAILQWTASTWATGYKIYYGTTSGQYGTPVEAGNVTQYTVPGLTTGATYYFAVSAVNSAGESTKSDELSAKISDTVPPPAVSITADPLYIGQGQSTLLGWQSANATSLSISPAIGSVSSSGTLSISPTVSTTYIITATGESGTTTAKVKVVVGEYIPTVSIIATPQVVPIGGSTTLSWSSANAFSLFIDHGIGPVAESGSTSVQLYASTTYTITATGPGGSSSSQVTVPVVGAQVAQPAGTFGGQYASLIPPDASVYAYDVKRFGVVRGEVKDSSNDPIAGVSITIQGHADYGTAHTDSNGRFALPVEGGGAVNVIYAKDGYITVHRQVQVPNNDIAVADTITMLTEDTLSTDITLDGDPQTVVVHRSTPVTTSAGTRQVSLVFTGDTDAYAVDSYGNDMFPITRLNVRATEFTTEQSMPAELPPASGFTYCAELKVDGVERVRFDKPVVAWLDNFLGFEVGDIVPSGYYDRDKGVWVASENGKVVRLLDTNSDGTVDALDADGDDQPDDLNNNSSYADEVQGLGNPSQYQPGETYWRVEVSHFSPWDWNWVKPFLDAMGAIFPNPLGGATADQQDCNDCNQSTASYVNCRSRTYHEDIDLPGTGLTLHYATNRVTGYHTIITVPASGAAVPSILTEIRVKLEIAGRVYLQTLSAAPNQVAVFDWDGLDFLGNRIGFTYANVTIYFVYGGFYSGFPADMTIPAFGLPGYLTTVVSYRGELSYTRRESIPVRNQSQVRPVLAEGWTLSNHHYLNAIDKQTLFKGDGTMIENDVWKIETIAGVAWNAGSTGDGLPATEALLAGPHSVTVDKNGNIIISDYASAVIRKVDTNGIITTIAGNGIYGYSGDNGPATQASLYPIATAVDNNGNIYVADQGNRVVRKIDTNGIITTFAGTSELGYSGDGGPATAAKFGDIYDVAVDNSGNVYILDYYYSCVRKVDTNGIITTYAGTGEGGLSGDNGPATQAQLYSPVGMALDETGNLFIADTVNNRIRKVDTTGMITTYAGASLPNQPGYSGDGGPALEAEFNFPFDVAVDRYGDVYITDYYNNRIRKVDTAGTITSLVGDAINPGYSGDGGAVSQAQINHPTGLAVDMAGNLYISDYWTSVVRKVSIPFGIPADAGDMIYAEEGLKYLFTLDGKHQQTIDPDTGKVLEQFAYDSAGRLESVTDRFGNEVRIERNSSGVPTSVKVMPDNIETQLTIDSNNQLTRITYPGGAYYAFEYTTSGLMEKETEPEGNYFTHTFNTAGRITEAEDQEGGEYQFGRTVLPDSGDVVTTVTGGEGTVTAFTDHFTSGLGVDSSIYVSGVTSPTLYSRSMDGISYHLTMPDQTVQDYTFGIDPEHGFQYLASASTTTPGSLHVEVGYGRTYVDTDSDQVKDLITDTVTFNGKTATVTHDTLTGLVTATSPLGRTVSVTYDPVTLLTSQVNLPGLTPTTYLYDTRGRLLSATTDTRSEFWAYDSAGNVLSYTNPKSQTTTYNYDSVGRVTYIYRPDSTVVSFTYDDNGNMTVLTNPASVSHNFTYDLVNRPETYDPPVSSATQWVYDKEGRLKQVTFPSTKQINNVYTGALLTGVQLTEGNVNLTYLSSGQVSTIAKSGEQIAYGYDGSVLTSETLSGTLAQGITYAYNNDFQLTSATYAGTASTFGYDNDGLLTSAGGYTITRDTNNGLPTAVAGGDLGVSRTFNGFSEVSAQSSEVNSLAAGSWSLTYDLNGQIATKSETFGGITANYTYTYDAQGRLLTVQKDGTLVEEYQYNSSSNPGLRTYEMNTLRGIVPGRSLTYNTEDHLQSVGGTTYTHNSDGYLSQKSGSGGTTQYTYSTRGELLTATLPDTRVISYVYDPLGRRIAKKINGTTVEKYLWTGLTRLLAVYDGSDNLVMRFEYADSRMPVSMTRSGSIYYLSYDQVGTLRAVYNASGSIVKRVDYDSFGNIITDTAPSFSVPLGFAGGLRDRDTNLVHFGYRDYDPETGRWTAKDPIGFNGGDVDLYGYVENDPVNWVDPEGLFGFPNAPWSYTPPLGGWGNIVGGICMLASAPELPLMILAAAAGALGWMYWQRRGKNRLPDEGVPGTVAWNDPKTTGKLYGPTGKTVKELNEGHPGHKSPGDKRHVHDYDPPNPKDPKGMPKRQPKGHPPTDQDKKDFGL